MYCDKCRSERKTFLRVHNNFAKKIQFRVTECDVCREALDVSEGEIDEYYDNKINRRKYK